jgi:hypothetical protein
VEPPNPLLVYSFCSWPAGSTRVSFFPVENDGVLLRRPVQFLLPIICRCGCGQRAFDVNSFDKCGTRSTRGFACDAYDDRRAALGASAGGHSDLCCPQVPLSSLLRSIVLYPLGIPDIKHALYALARRFIHVHDDFF